MVRQAADKGGREWPCLKVRGAGVRPDSAISAASEIARRKNKSFAQYTGRSDTRPYRKGLNRKFWPRLSRNSPQGLRANSFLREAVNQVSLGGFRGPLALNQTRIADPRPAIRHRTRKIDAYSAAAASEAFGFADDTMKSEMRGTISDLNREPLNTP